MADNLGPVFSALAIFCCHWGSTFSGSWHGYWCLCRCHFHLLLYPFFRVSIRLNCPKIGKLVSLIALTNPYCHKVFFSSWKLSDHSNRLFPFWKKPCISTLYKQADIEKTMTSNCKKYIFSTFSIINFINFWLSLGDN